MGVKFGLTP